MFEAQRQGTATATAAPPPSPAALPSAQPAKDHVEKNVAAAAVPAAAAVAAAGGVAVANDANDGGIEALALTEVQNHESQRIMNHEES